MQPPNNTEVFELKLCTIWVDQDGIFNAISKPIQRTMTNSRELIEFIHKIAHGKKVCELADVSKSSGFDKGAREYLKEEIPKVYKAIALLTYSYMGKIIGNIVLTFIQPGIPIRLFTDESEARTWLLEMKNKE